MPVSINLWTPIIVGALLGFGAAAGVVSFCLLSEMSILMQRYVRRKMAQLEHWRKQQ